MQDESLAIVRTAISDPTALVLIQHKLPSPPGTEAARWEKVLIQHKVQAPLEDRSRFVRARVVATMREKVVEPI